MGLVHPMNSTAYVSFKREKVSVSRPCWCHLPLPALQTGCRIGRRLNLCSMHILSSKLTRPAPPPRIVDRLHLYARLDQWQTTPVVFIHAPAGYGKSILASRWLEVRGLDAQAAWLSLDPGDDDPLQFLRYLAAALEPVAPGIIDAVQPLLDEPEAKAERALAVLLGMLQGDPQAADEKPLLLVLDDLQQVDSPALAPLMTLLLERCPARLHLMLLGRKPIYGPLARLYAAEQVLELSVVELRFQPDEMASYLAQRGFPPPTPEALARLDARTEGWIVALQLMAAAAGDKRDINALLAAAQSGRGWLAEYLTTQILADLSPAKRTFLLQTAILERFNRSLLAAVSGVTDVDDLLSALIEAGLPLVQLDSRREWFRYHHFFQELLQARLRQALSSADIAELHRRAAAWLAEHDQVSAAVQHALSADDLNLAAAILETAVRPEISRGGFQQAESWLALFPNNALDQHPHLLLDLCLLDTFRVQANLVDLVTRTDAALASAQLAEEERRRKQAELTIYKIVIQFSRREFETVRELLRDTEQWLADAEPLFQGLLAALEMHLAWYGRQREVMLIKGNQAIEAFRDAGCDHAVLSVLTNRAAISAHYGHPREALAMLQEIVVAAQTNCSFSMSELADAHVNAMNLHYWMDDIEGARREQQAALALAQRLADPVLVREIDSLSALFAMARATGKSSGIEDSWPLDTVSRIPQLNRLHLHKLVRQGQVERAAHFTTAFGVQIDSEISTENVYLFIFLLKAIIARGIGIDGVRPRIAAAIAQAEGLDSQLFAAELYALSAWAHLQLGRREEAEQALARALDLAVETGYVRFILDIPALAPLLAVMEHPAASGMWVATVPEEVREQAAQLTDQERLVLAQLMRTARYQDIAGSMGISINTVRTHIRHIYRKLGVKKRKDAVARAHALGLIAQDELILKINGS